jgi:hypothetical protein
MVLSRLAEMLTWSQLTIYMVFNDKLSSYEHHDFLKTTQHPSVGPCIY